MIGSQAWMSTLSMIGSAPGGTVVQVAAAAAMLASDGARGSGGTVNPDDIGKPSQAALAMAERLRQPTVPAAPPNPDELSSAQPDAPATTIEGIRSGFIYYHRTQPLYEPGDRILPGMWGRLVLGTGPAHSSFYREMVWEMVRCAVAPDAHSRLPAAFVFEEFDTAQAFRSDRPEYVYVVRFDAALRTHRADMSLIDVATRHRSVADVEAIVRRYWAGEIIDPKQVEVLVDGELEVVARLTGPDRPAA